MLIRLIQLGSTSYRVIKEQGVGTFIKRIYAWLRGERDYFRTLRPQRHLYEDYRIRIEPNRDDLEVWKNTWPEWETQPHFSIITILSTSTNLRRTIASVQDQIYVNWSWQITDATPAGGLLRQIAALAKGDTRITVSKVSHLETAAVKGDYVLVLRGGDQLAPYAFYTLVEAIQKHPDIDVIYSDIDELDGDGKRDKPLFMPDWSPETMLSFNLLYHSGVYRRDIWTTGAPFANLWDFTFRVAEHAATIHHIRQVLFHCGFPKVNNDDRAVTAHLERSGLLDPIVFRDKQNAIRVRWRAPRERRISIIIPSRDHAELLLRCLVSLFDTTAYTNYEVIVVDTGSVERSTYSLYESYRGNSRFKLVHYEGTFNFSKACNLGAAHAQDEMLLFLNNDTEILQDNWLHLMSQWFENPAVGVVGPKLLYPDGKIQHAGVIVGMHGLGDNLFANASEHLHTIFGSDDWYRNLQAVTGACLMIPRAVFDQVGGFDETYQLVFSDVELCLQVREAGYRVVYTPDVRLIHHESATHLRNIPIADLQLATIRLQSWLFRGDPFFNPNLTYQNPIPEFNRHSLDTPYENNIRSMAAFLESE